MSLTTPADIFGGKSPGARWLRRAITIPAYHALLLLGVVGFPLWLGVAGGLDLLHGGRMARTRALLFSLVFAASEVSGIWASFGLWLWWRLSRHDIDSFHRHNFALQCWWAKSLYRAGSVIFSLRTEVGGAETVRTGPFILFLRHSSLADTLFPAVFVSAAHGIILRYVLKRELLWDPCLDIVGNRLPNCFVRRGAVDSAAEIAAVGRLAENLGPFDGVVIYPEGTRFSEEKRTRILERLQDSEPERFTTAARFRCVLPPRTGGALELLRRAPSVDVVFCGHTGLESAATLRDFVLGGLVGQVVRLVFWRVPAASIPHAISEQRDWLFDQWSRLDEWVAAGVGNCRKMPKRELIP